MNPVADDQDGVGTVKTFPNDRVALCRLWRAEALDLLEEVGNTDDFRYKGRD